MRRFRLVRHEDVTGVSGTGHVADGLENDDGTAVVFWRGEWPTLAVHTRGMASVEHIHCHGGLTSIEWVDDDTGHPLRAPGEQYREQRMQEPTITDPAALQAMMALGRPKTKVITCQVLQDGDEKWSDEPTDAECAAATFARSTRPGDWRGIITLDRSPA